MTEFEGLLLILINDQREETAVQWQENAKAAIERAQEMARNAQKISKNAQRIRGTGTHSDIGSSRDGRTAATTTQQKVTAVVATAVAGIGAPAQKNCRTFVCDTSQGTGQGRAIGRR
jgi:hypothetical protein